MRRRRRSEGISVRAISGLHVVTLGMNTRTDRARRGLLGFGIHRTDHTEHECYWLKGFKTFRSVEPNPVPGRLYSTLKHPVQTFLWGDYTAKSNHTYTYKVVHLYGDPANPEQGDAVSVRINTESEEDRVHTIYFNRGVAGSQAYAREFQNRKPDDVPGRQAYKWLSRGLEEALLGFIASARGRGYGLRAAVYEFNYDPVLQAFKDAHDRGVDVRVVYDSRREHPKDSTEQAVRRMGISRLMTPRCEGRSYISHNKFIILLRNGRPLEVWTGSTNITRGGIFGQSNVGHIVRDAGTAGRFYAYWQQLADDATPADLRVWNDRETPVPGNRAPEGTTPIFSPRGSLAALEWYARRLDHARKSAALTAAFGVNQKLAEVLQKDKPYLRYLLLERKGSNYDVYAQDRDVQVSIGSHFTRDTLYRWTREELTYFNVHVRYIHTKFMLIDPLGRNPLVITGSANFSDASTRKNDENMLIIRGNTRVADIYLGEFMRLFNHFYFRYHASRIRRRRLTASQRTRSFLHEDNSWTDRYFRPDSVKMKQRLLFA